MDACVLVAMLMITGAFFLFALVLGSFLFVLGITGGGLLLVLLGANAILNGNLAAGLGMLAGGLALTIIGFKLMAIVGSGSANAERRRR